MSAARGVCLAAGFAAIAVLLAGCGGDSCLPSELLYGCTSWISKYEQICCKVPQHYAEHRGFLREPDVRFFDRLLEMKAAVEAGGATAAGVADAAGADELSGVHIRLANGAAEYEWIFYDSQCGLPLFVAPRGRDFESWRSESEVHGWPSFRDTEVLPGAILMKQGDEVVSRCPRPTHLGHRFTDHGGHRYCIDLLCMAGQAANDTALPQLGPAEASRATPSASGPLAAPTLALALALAPGAALAAQRRP